MKQIVLLLYLEPFIEIISCLKSHGYITFYYFLFKFNIIFHFVP